ncbi:pentapeptide repeat-containing protein [Streptomyces recifensis]|uniref:pentapeptide repeat-containing protein n=1 Tax=Streptomyces recifensis TaxID=67355 RepID=UPI001FCA1604|nr:pentapeptide repeat-containing protein [Streptomyces recifensis]
MPHPSPEPHPTPPGWPHCGHGTTAEDTVGCRGIHAPGHTSCLAHLADADRDAYLDGLIPGADIDHRGTSFTDSLLVALLEALLDPTTGHARIGEARFDSATFQDDAYFIRATFGGHAWFDSATFQGLAGFDSATFQGLAGFDSATFQGLAGFDSATFRGSAHFDSASFQGYAGFRSATFHDLAWFDSATFQGITKFDSATFKHLARFDSASFQDGSFVRTGFQGIGQFGQVTFEGHASFEYATFRGAVRFRSAIFESDARFDEATFERLVTLGPLVCAGRFVLSEATFSGPASLSFAARRLECLRTRWTSTAELRLRYATVDFAHAVFEYSLTIAAAATPFVLPDGQPVDERVLDDAPGAAVRMASLRGVDAAHLVLADVDLSGCLFTGTVHLDQLRLEGACIFDTVPAAVHWRGWRPDGSPSAAPSPKNTTGARASHRPSRAGTWQCSAPSTSGRCNWRRCTARCAKRSRMASTNLGPPTSTTGRWRCAATPTTSLEASEAF